MGLLDFFFPVNVPDSDQADNDEPDQELLYEMGRHWVKDAASSDNEIRDYQIEAVEYIAEESGGGFWDWLWGG